MGFMKRWDVANIEQQIKSCAMQLRSPYNDGFVAWECKKDLYEIAWLLDSILQNSPKFSHLEEEYLQNKKHEHLLQILKD